MLAATYCMYSSKVLGLLILLILLITLLPYPDECRCQCHWIGKAVLYLHTVGGPGGHI